MLFHNFRIGWKSLRRNRVLSLLIVSGVFAVHVIDSSRSVDSASAPTNAYPVSGVPPGPVTVIPFSVAVVVVPRAAWSSAGRPETPV